ncbi:DDE-type integrase/transposase/recombinase [Leptospira mayottensis]|uniref:Transposase n=3 Tax=Leptospira mayottensis TaxID=1137606 RepID=A0ABM6Y857_9LEPT|nr:DDE-type integrase/transposase/recombinase [Leptospira mayottensis]AXR60311.1 transposase [Leptospira mayottensis]AXR60313.1 transposase [Leptospira mayottensis]AXR64072.1 transposase [Leptospira mayottensis]AXR64074.1 transposase [Leptospira mayottensis]AZQ03261.1 transposase [Leptospira mayottensis 200901116]
MQTATHSSVILPTIPKKNRNSYDTFWKFNVANGVITSEQLKGLPKSTVHSLKNKDPDSFRHIYGFRFNGMEPNLQREANYLSIRLENSLTLQKGIIALAKIKLCLLQIKSLPKKMKNSIQVKEKIVRTIQRVRDDLGFERTLRKFHISKSTFHSWFFQVRFRCSSSWEKLCHKRFVGQISVKEIDSLKNLLLEKATLFWPLSSIWGYARKNDILHCSLSSFYKWARVIRPELFSNKFKKLKKEGFKTYRPNEVWHCDITQFVTKDNVKSHIYILIDNFSKMILAFRVAAQVDSDICASLVEEAISKYQTSFSKLTLPDLFPLINLNLSKESSFVHLMTDGGPENQGALDRMIFDYKLPINKITAGKDVSFSNSPIEAIHKITKYQCLHHLDIPNRQSLIQKLSEWIPIYNDQRPNRAGRYLLTPSEIFRGKSIDSNLLNQQSKDAKKQRYLLNKVTSCGVC